MANSWAHNLLLKPTLLSGPMLALVDGSQQAEKAAVKNSEREARKPGWLQVWKSHEASRQIWERLRAGFTAPERQASACLWADDGQWVAWQFRVKGSGNWVLLAEPAEVVRQKAQEALRT